MKTPRWTSKAALTIALTTTLALSACTDAGSEDPAADDSASDDAAASSAASSTEAADTFPFTVDTGAGEVTIEERPERIVSLSPSSTEILFAVGAGDQVVAVDEYSTHPAEAPMTDLSGYEPNVEAIVGYDPDLVVVSNDTNDLVASLTELDIPVLVNSAPLTIEAGYEPLIEIARATGHTGGGEQVVEQMRTDIAAAFDTAEAEEGLRVYHELGDSFYSASSDSFIGSVYHEFGAVNIADQADSDGSGYPQLTEEAIVAANPQLIVITDQSGYSAADVAARPGWDEIDAVADDNIVVVNADIASRWGPRLPELVETVAEAMSSVDAPGGS